MNPVPLTAPTLTALPDTALAAINAPIQLARKRHDPILEELWAIKAQINAEANYDIGRLMEMAQKAAAPYISEDGRVRILAKLPLATSTSSDSAL